MVRSKGNSAVAEKPKELLSQTEIETLRDEQRDIQNSINEAKSADGSSRAGAIDVNKLQGKVNHIEKSIQDRTPEQARGKAKDSLHREEIEIEDRLTIGMPTRYEMDHPARCPGAVRKHLAWLKRNNPLIERYVEIQKILRPEEPNSIEALRKDK